jgi:streptomycin 6-kinase
MGEPGQTWLATLEDQVQWLEKSWDIQVGEVLSGGSEALVMSTRRAGRSAVLKIGLPAEEGLRHEARLLSMAKGRGYAELFAFDATRNAMLVEQLGRPMGDCGFSVQAQIELLCETAAQAWMDAVEDNGFMNGVGKARWLREFIESAVRKSPGVISTAVKEQALAFTHSREQAWSPGTSKLIHGDVHAFNSLSDPKVPGCFRLIDPDGYFMEPAYDLGLIMRDYHEDLRAAPFRLGQVRAETLAKRTGLDPQAIWEWGFIERVTTGLYLLQLGERDEGTSFLHIAESWLG